MPRKPITLMLCSLMMVCFVSLPVIGADDDAEPKYKIKDVMNKAMKGGNSLIKKVAGGKASDAEKKELYDLLVALGKNKPPKGDAKSWEKLTGALAKAGKAAVDGDPKAGEMLTAASKCGACHTPHRPKKD